MSEQAKEPAAIVEPSLKRNLTPQALRALEEARKRREAHADIPARPKEIHGRNGPDPVRYGDWEVNGIASDF